MLSERTIVKFYQDYKEGIPLYFMQNQKWYKELNGEQQAVVKKLYDTITIREVEGYLKSHKI